VFTHHKWQISGVFPEPFGAQAQTLLDEQAAEEQRLRERQEQDAAAHSRKIAIDRFNTSEENKRLIAAGILTVILT
jgi:hypothetical protein